MNDTASVNLMLKWQITSTELKRCKYKTCYDVKAGTYITYMSNQKTPTHTYQEYIISFLLSSVDGRSKGPGDVEQGKKVDNKPPTDEIIPVYRRDCHEEVYCGSHSYPGRGVYLLKFDNSYSLWRSKTLYYRVYYTRWGSVAIDRVTRWQYCSWRLFIICHVMRLAGFTIHR